MIKPVEKSEILQISLTGARALVIIGLLIQQPHSLDEIRQKFIEFNLMDDNQSNDILRIDLNTLRAMGLEISRSTKKTNFKYVLKKHFFTLKITHEEIVILKKAYKHIKQNANIEMLMQYDTFFKKLAEYVSDDQIKEELYGISALRHFNDLSLIKELYIDCKYSKTVKLIYKSAISKEPKEKEVIAQNLKFKNDKIYLYGYELNSKESVTLNIKYILKIISRNFKKSENVNIESVNLKFKLKNLGVAGLEECEKIVQQQDDGYIIQGEYHNEFIAIQRILSFGSDCTILEPESIKIKVIEKLKKIKEIYGG